MRQPIEIDNRLYTSILQWCDANGIEPVKYIEKALRERLATDKYGDLNDKVRKEDSGRNVPENTPISPKPEIHIVPQEKTKEKPKEEEPVEQVLQEIDENPIETAPETSEASGVEENPIKKKRVLKTK